MKIFYIFLYIVGVFLIAVFLLWRAAPADLYTVTFAAEIFAVLSCALGVTCLIAAHNLRREYAALTQELLRRARAEADAAVRAQVETLETELAAAREYIARMDHE